VWSQARLVKEVKAEVSTLSLSVSLSPPLLSFPVSPSHPQGVADRLGGQLSDLKYLTLDCLM